MTTTVLTVDTQPADRLETFTFAATLAFVVALQFSIGVAGVIVTVAMVGWISLVVARRERIEVPPLFWWLAAYGVVTLASAVFSPDPLKSIVDCKQLALFLIVPGMYRVARGRRALTVVTVIITAGGISALIGILQFSIFEFDNLGKRPHGWLTHYMTYSGVLMLVITTAVARVLFGKEERTWAALVLPALVVALTVSLSRNAWFGTCVAVGLLFVLRDLRLLALAPVLAAVVFALAPLPVTDRILSGFDIRDPTNRDRLAMARSGLHMIRDHPIFGVGPDMITRVYAQYRDPDAVEELVPHLHNVPIQIAAERGLPALVVWLGLVGILIRDHWRRLRRSEYASLAAGGLAATAAMLAAGMFEYNFGDSEFLMLYLVLVTLPYAADRPAEDDAGR